ncbi:SDR family NAD(P)-dependent oxidoreductase [Arenicella xantha]|uniref:3-hydroxy acid dehydrogenase/malonic semialdehyde reductase n=1 Tax=Arenicella xantha TaxID=644221 RepID=A0A395JVZ7_9GAMM|nr:SDR family NAD(P)-dependent oxidoreductase [Arenicella xantha]RBP53738.1 3-hydroxy acid dehydrogenase/malonic semialdehyde reductase [Arenicella xantha]
MKSKTALITGASVGIGRATALILAEQGYQLILLARRLDKLQELQNELSVASHLIACDINDHEALDQALQNLPQAFKDIDVLVNNAGLALGLNPADTADWSDWQTMIQTNCVSLAYLTHQVLPAMVARNTGHVINLGSIAGNYAYRGGNAYGATKAFVAQFSKNLRADLLGKQIRVTNLVPGIIGNTEFSLVRFHGDKDSANAVYQDCQALTPEDIAETIRWVVSLPEHVNINEIELMPTCQASGGLAVSKSN